MRQPDGAPVRPLSLAHLTVMDADPVTLIEAAAGAEFDAVGLRIVAPPGAVLRSPVLGDVSLQRRIKRRLAETGIQVWDVEAIWLGGDTDVGLLRPALDLGAELGATQVVVAGDDPDPGRMEANLAALCEAAHQRGLRVMLEFIPYSEVRSLADAHAMLVRVAPADTGLLVDALHLCRSGSNPADLAACDPALFGLMHLCDAPLQPPRDLRAEARAGRLLPGEGELPLAAFIAAFPTGTPVAIEAPTVRDAGASPADRAKRAALAYRHLAATAATGLGDAIGRGR